MNFYMLSPVTYDILTLIKEEDAILQGQKLLGLVGTQYSENIDSATMAQ